MTDFVVMGLAMLGTGIVGGILAGLLGVGGGIVIVPVLEIVLGLLGVPVEIRMHVAVATSLAVIIPTSISSARAHHSRQSVDFDLVNAGRRSFCSAQSPESSLPVTLTALS